MAVLFGKSVSYSLLLIVLLGINNAFSRDGKFLTYVSRLLLSVYMQIYKSKINLFHDSC